MQPESSRRGRIRKSVWLDANGKLPDVIRRKKLKTDGRIQDAGCRGRMEGGRRAKENGVSTEVVE